jgi:hypothetical protein
MVNTPVAEHARLADRRPSDRSRRDFLAPLVSRDCIAGPLARQNASGRALGIPDVLRDMRDEYARARQDLWDLILQAWYAPSYAGRDTSK